jgi:hypothetical protein
MLAGQQGTQRLVSGSSSQSCAMARLLGALCLGLERAAQSGSRISLLLAPEPGQ